MKRVVQSLFEVGILSKTPRSGYHLMGSGTQSVAEHVNRVTYIGYVLASLEENVDILKVIKMCMFHDTAEGRVSDLNYVHQKYINPNEEAALKDFAKDLPFEEDILAAVQEYEERDSPEAIIAKDADNLEWILSLKEQIDTGNAKAGEWIGSAIQRLKSENAKKIAKEIMNSSSDDWWFTEKESDWWINRNGKLK